MDNEKILKLMEKMYAEMQGGFKEVKQRLDSLEERVEETAKVVKRIGATIEVVIPKLDQFIESGSNLRNTMEELEKGIMTVEISKLRLNEELIDNFINENNEALKELAK